MDTRDVFMRDDLGSVGMEERCSILAIYALDGFVTSYIVVSYTCNV